MFRTLTMVILVAAAGCDIVGPRVTARLDSLLKEIELARRDIERTSDDWRAQLTSMQKNLTDDASEIITRDVIQAIREEGLCTIDYLEGKFKSYLVELEKELKRQRKLIKDRKSPLSDDEAIAKAVDRVGKLPPHVCSFSPMKFRYLNEYGAPPRLGAVGSDASTVSGFYLLRDPDEIELRIANGKEAPEEGRVLTDGHQFITPSTNYRWVIGKELLARQLRPGDRQLSIYWTQPPSDEQAKKNETNAPILLGAAFLEFESAPQPPPAVKTQHIEISGTLKLVDHEYLGRNEVKTVDRTAGPFLIARTNSLNKSKMWVNKHGGEVRGEVDLIANVDQKGRLELELPIRLYEGRSENTTDLDGTGSLLVNVDADSEQSASYTVRNEEVDSDDSVTVTVKVTNKTK